MGAASAEFQRVCFVSRVRPDRLEQYRERHRHVWPDMRQALQNAGWTNYSLFADDTGLVVGYLQCADFAAASAAMAASDVNSSWQAEMAPFFEGLGDRRPDTAIQPLPEIFYLP